jgi:hypothetical protein
MSKSNPLTQQVNTDVPYMSHPVNPDFNNLATQHVLTEIRRSLPKIETFDGKPEKWLTFQRAVERTWREGKYPDDLIKLKIRQALSGQPLARVDGLMDFMSAAKIMEFLKESYGNSNVIVETAKQKLLNVKMSKPLTHSSCIEVTTLIANYIAACNYAGLLVADSTISARIHTHLEPFHQQAYYEFYFHEYPNATTRIERLDVQFKFLNHLSKTLPIGIFKQEENKGNRPSKGQQFQVMSASMNNSLGSGYSCTSYNSARSSSSSDDYKFEIRDIKMAKYSGYNLDKEQEITRKCELCGRTDHFTVECRSYREMNIDARFNAVKIKNLCPNCLLTSTHTSKDCNVKTGCGYKLDTHARCSAKHHITLHRGNGGSNYKPKVNTTYRKQRSRAQSNRNPV